MAWMCQALLSPNKTKGKDKSHGFHGGARLFLIRLDVLVVVVLVVVAVVVAARRRSLLLRRRASDAW